MKWFKRKTLQLLAVFLVITCNFVFWAISGKGTDIIAKAESNGSGVAVDENEEACVPGDINADGEVNNKDLIRLFKYVSGWEAYVDPATVDTNGDLKVNNKDLILLFQYISDWEVSLYCKGIRIYNIRSYGAEGDGQTDDTVAINACITAGAGNGVYIPAGEYVVNGAITVPSDTMVFGDGDLSTIKMHDNYNNGEFTHIAWRPETAPSNKVTTYSLITTAENSKNIVLRDFSLVGGEKLTNSDGIWGITVYKSENCLCENINIKNINYNAERIGEVYSFGLFVFKSNNVTVRGGVYEYCGYENIGMEYSENVTVENCYLGTAWRVPLQCHRGSHHIKVVGNIIVSTDCDKTHSLLTLHGQAITGFNDCVSDVLIENNYFKGVTSTKTHPYCGGIQSVWQNEQDIRIIGNTFECSNYCIVNASDRHEGTYVSGGWTITGNTIKGKYGISLWDDNIILEDNIIDTTGTAVAVQTKTENGYKSIVNNDYLNNYDVLGYVVR